MKKGNLTIKQMQDLYNKAKKYESPRKVWIFQYKWPFLRKVWMVDL